MVFPDLLGHDASLANDHSAVWVSWPTQTRPNEHTINHPTPQGGQSGDHSLRLRPHHRHVEHDLVVGRRRGSVGGGHVVEEGVAERRRLAVGVREPGGAQPAEVGSAGPARCAPCAGQTTSARP